MSPAIYESIRSGERPDRAMFFFQQGPDNNGSGALGQSRTAVVRPKIRRIVPRLIRRRAPQSLRFRMMQAYAFVRESAIDYSDWLLGRKGAFTPPRHVLKAAHVEDRFADIERMARGILRCMIELADLGTSETVLEVGCGIGRNASALTKYFDQKGIYEGFDIVPLGIGWCQQKISREYPNFHFRLSDVYNKAYNPKGKLKPSEYKFPYKDGVFDFVFLTSVFTHMMPDDVARYLSEIARVLKTGGRCMMTIFLLNQESSNLLNSGMSHLALRHESGPCRFADQQVPEAAVAYREEYIKAICRKEGLAITEPIRYGSWCGRTRATSFIGQDIIMTRKVDNDQGPASGLHLADPWAQL